MKFDLYFLGYEALEDIPEDAADRVRHARDMTSHVVLGFGQIGSSHTRAHGATDVHGFCEPG